MPVPDLTRAERRMLCWSLAKALSPIMCKGAMVAAATSAAAAVAVVAVAALAVAPGVTGEPGGSPVTLCPFMSSTGSSCGGIGGSGISGAVAAGVVVAMASLQWQRWKV